MKRRVFVQLTWGILGNILGVFVFIVFGFLCLINKKEYFMVKNDYFGVDFYRKKPFGEKLRRYSGWGFSIGFVSVLNVPISLYPSIEIDLTKKLIEHETGHAIQNGRYGPLMLLFYLASYLRYWFVIITKKIDDPKFNYESFLVRGSSNQIGSRVLQQAI